MRRTVEEEPDIDRVENVGFHLHVRAEIP